jgi:chaperonin GroEL
VATIEVGAPSAPEALALHARLEDALTALRSALSEGVVTGGGVALLRSQAAARAVPLAGGAKAGAEAVAASLGEPARWIAQNAGADGEEIVAALQAASGDTGFDASQGRIVDLARAGILDPARVVRVAFEQAAAVAALILTTETLVVDDGEPEPPQRDEPGG